MSLSLKAKFIFLVATSVSIITLTSIENQITDSELAHYSTQQLLATEVIQRHMEGDMMHDGIRGNVYSTLYGAKTGNAELVSESSSEIKDMVDTFTTNVDENRKQELPADIKAQLEKVHGSVASYGQTAFQIIRAANNPEQAEALLPKFSKAFDILEEDQGKTSELLLQWSGTLKTDAENAAQRSTLIMNVLNLVSILVALIVPVFAVRSVFKPQSKMIEAMKTIADGDTTINIPYTARKDEMGEMARTVQIFKDNALRIIQMAKEQDVQKKLAEEQRRKALQDLATTFETNVKSVVDIVASAATEMDATSRSVASISDNNQNKLSQLNGEISSTSKNVQMVASATSELSSAVNEISQQVARATNIAANAVQEAHSADVTVQGLTEAAQRIGEVLEMINSIAAQINLLALNATIEAARAGDAGKGFAVVASEVKNLANQTTKATEQISQYIESIQGATSETVGAIKRIGGTINEINQISTTIAAAVEEQGVATQDIARNVQQAATGTESISHNASQVASSSVETGVAANQMMSATSELSRQAETLRSEVDKFLVGVRNS